MKKHLLFLAFCSAASLLCAQIQLEHTYPKGTLKRINLDVSGEMYLLKPLSCMYHFFDKTHAPFFDVYLGDGVYFTCGDDLISEKMLDADDGIEIIYSWFDDGMCLANGTSVWDGGANQQIDPNGGTPKLSSDYGLEPKILLNERVFSVPGPVLEYQYGYHDRVTRTFLPIDGERYVIYNTDEFDGFRLYKANHNLAKSVYLPMELSHVTQQYFNDDALLEFYGVRYVGSSSANGNQLLAKIVQENGDVLLSEPCSQAPLFSTLPNLPDRLMIRSYSAPGQWQEKVLDVKTLALLHTFPFRVNRVSPDGATDFYIHVSDNGGTLSLYNSSFLFEKNVTLPFPIPSNWNVGVTRNRFTQSGKLEFYYTAKNGPGAFDNQVVCIDEDGAVLHTFLGANAAMIDQQPGMNDKFFVRYYYGDSTQVYDFTNQTTSTLPSPTNVVLKISPNPFSQSFEIQLPQTGDYFIRLTDITGRIVATQNVQNQSSAKFDMESNAPAGVYFMTVGGRDFQWTTQVVKN